MFGENYAMGLLTVRNFTSRNTWVRCRYQVRTVRTAFTRAGLSHCPFSHRVCYLNENIWTVTDLMCNISFYTDTFLENDEDRNPSWGHLLHLSNEPSGHDSNDVTARSPRPPCDKGDIRNHKPLLKSNK